VAKKYQFNPSNASNPICHLLALLRAHLIIHISRIRVKEREDFNTWKGKLNPTAIYWHY